MKRILGAALGAVLIASACQQAADTDATPASMDAAPSGSALSADKSNIEADMRFLASD